uniref:Uncharacterized protein n=1 Tax=Octopus bimaculoides TaxID=37653 RepID=A0A0L8FJF2_OCTBM
MKLRYEKQEKHKEQKLKKNKENNKANIFPPHTHEKTSTITGQQTAKIDSEENRNIFRLESFL